MNTKRELPNDIKYPQWDSPELDELIEQGWYQCGYWDGIEGETDTGGPMMRPHTQGIMKPHFTSQHLAEAGITEEEFLKALNKAREGSIGEEI